jgi:hypothetical protein
MDIPVREMDPLVWSSSAQAAPAPGRFAPPSQPAWTPPTSETGGQRSFVPTEPSDEDEDQWQLDVSSRIADVPLLRQTAKDALDRLGVRDVSDLLDAEPADIAAQFADPRVCPDTVLDWQTRLLLQSFVPGLSPRDARLLSACGIANPDQLSEADANQLMVTVQHFLERRSGRQLSRRERRHWATSIRTWIRRARRGRARWRRSKYCGRWLPAHQARWNRFRGHHCRLYPSVPGGDHGEAEPPRDAADSARTTAFRFFLQLEDPLVQAPSIGPRTAERFACIGISTVADLLRADPVWAAQQMAYRRVSANTIRQWQHQARLVCQIPQLRGHDAQVLVGCGITEPKALMQMEPEQLLAKVDTYVSTKEGAKTIRSANRPDLNQIANWITWAGHSRMLHAA